MPTSKSLDLRPGPAAATQPEGRVRAATIIAPGRIELRDVPLPVPAAHEIRVRVYGCGVCASNVPVWEGRPWFNYPQEPGAPGHEGWGVVDAVGGEVDTVQEGDHVAFLSYHAYADYDSVDKMSVLKLPFQFQDAPFLGEPLACAMNVFRRCDVASGQTVAIVGIGFLGALLTQLAVAAGARVFAISRRPAALKLASGIGANQVLPISGDAHEVIERVMQATQNEGCERVIEVTGKQEPLDLAGQLTRVRGRLIIAGYHQDGLRQVNMQLWNWRGIDVINAHERDPQIYISGMQDAAEAVQSGRLDPTSLYTHHFPLEQLGEALTAAQQRPQGFIKALVWMNPR